MVTEAELAEVMGLLTEERLAEIEEFANQGGIVDLDYEGEWRDEARVGIRALVAEVRRLRAQVAEQVAVIERQDAEIERCNEATDTLNDRIARVARALDGRD